MGKRIFWVSRHSMNGIQMGALRRMFGDDVEVVEDRRPFHNAEAIVERYQQGHFDDIIVVAPFSVLDRMVKLGLRPLWSQAEVVNDLKRSDWRVKDRHYRFTGFKRVKALELVFENLGPDADRRDND